MFVGKEVENLNTETWLEHVTWQKASTLGNVTTGDGIGLGTFVASELDKVFSGYQPR